MTISRTDSADATIATTAFSRARGFLSGDPRLYDHEAPDDRILGVFRAEQVAAITRATPAAMAASICNALVAVFILHSHDNTISVSLWAFVLITLCSFIFLKQRGRGNRRQPSIVSRRVIRKAVLYAAAMGALWACLPLFFYADSSRSAQIVIACLSTGMLCGAAFVLATLPSAVLAFIAPLTVASLITLTRSGEIADNTVVLLLIAYAYVLLHGSILYARQLLQQVVDRVKAEEEARTDPLTGLLNRRGFTERLEHTTLDQLRRHGAPFAILYLDLDAFKGINDDHGHAAGDELLRIAARRISAGLEPDDLVARLGGDEFGVICHGVREPGVAARIAARITRAFAAAIEIDGHEINCGVSIGIALAPDDGRDTQTLLRNADTALYAAKRAKPGDYAFYRTEIDARISHRNTLSASLRHGLETGQFFLEFLPIYSLADNRIHGFEALLRWRHPDLGLIAPSTFIPIADELGLLPHVGEWSINNACAAMSAWPDHVRVSLNLSPAQLRSPTMAQSIFDTMDRYGLPLSRLEIEITETISLENDRNGVGFVKDMHANGVAISLDDFGAGRSPLTYLCKLPITRVKIDRSFIASALEQRESMAVVQAILGLAHSLDIKVVAEGVENRSQLAFVTAFGCDEAQGYYLSPPVSAERAAAMALEPNVALTEAA